MWVPDAVKVVAKASLFPQHTHLLLMNLTELKRRMRSIQTAFDDALPHNNNKEITSSSSSSLPPVKFLHAFAVKANPLECVLTTALRESFGLETASIGEFMLAERVWKNNNNNNNEEERRIIFDSPTKTLEELYHALQQPCFLNVDNFEELERIIAIQKGEYNHHHHHNNNNSYPTSFPPLPRIRAVIGIRVNPQTVKQTSNDLLATGGIVSKFGVPLLQEKEKIIEYYKKYHSLINLRMIHVHSGSQGLSLQVLVDGVKAIYDAIIAVDEEMEDHIIQYIDIGGGFPVDFTTDDEHKTVQMKDYVKLLKEQVPSLFTWTPKNNNSHNPNVDGGSVLPTMTQRTIITEFGRSIAAKSGVLISRVEYVKYIHIPNADENENNNTNNNNNIIKDTRQMISQHIGADLAVRTVWQPSHWPLRVKVFDSFTGEEKKQQHNNKLMLSDVAGPCCNSGCVLARAIPLPFPIQPLKDLIVVHDVGGYYHSSFSLYNLRQMPAVFAYHEEEDNEINNNNNNKRPREGAEMSSSSSVKRLVCVKKPQSVEDTIQLFETDS